MSAELFKLTYNLDLTMVPFTSAGLAVNSVLGNHTPVILRHCRRPLRRSKTVSCADLPYLPTNAFPYCPTCRHSRKRAFATKISTLTGIVVPAGTPKEIVDRLHQEIVKIGALPDVREKLQHARLHFCMNTPAEFGVRIKTEMTKWAKVVQAAKLKIE